MSLPPGPGTPNWWQLGRWLRAPFPFLRECRSRYGETFTLQFPFFGSRSLVIFSNPDHVREIFSDDGSVMHAGKANIVLEPFVGKNSVLILDGAAHMRQRKLLMPPFHGERMQAYGQQMIDITDADIDAWPVGSPFAMHKRTQDITLSVIVRAVFGIEDLDRFHELTKLLDEGLRIISWAPMMFPLMQKDLGPWSPWGRFQRVANSVDKILVGEIESRRRDGCDGRADILSLLLAARDEAGRPMTNEELRDELVTLLLAGHETTATSLVWALRWILDTPGLVDRLDAELRTAVDGARLVPEKLVKLELLDAVVKESLRLQPVIPMVGRVLQRDATVGPWRLPAGTAALVSVYLVHQREDLYPEPARFRPERFLQWKPGSHEWIPFGGGLRRCIGAAFAQYEMKMVLGAMLTRARLRLAPTRPIHEVRRHITLSPSEGLRVVADELHSRGAMRDRARAA